MSDFEKKIANDSHSRDVSPWTDKKAKNPTAVDIMIKKKRDAQK